MQTGSSCGLLFDLRYVTNVTLATSESWKDKNTGEQQERTMVALIVSIWAVTLITASTLYIVS
jgi:hypothetical protein